jgi:hypothetical protein
VALRYYLQAIENTLWGDWLCACTCTTQFGGGGSYQRAGKSIRGSLTSQKSFHHDQEKIEVRARLTGVFSLPHWPSHEEYLDMLPNRPLFTVGDAVFEVFPLGNTSQDRGIVIERYELEGEYRYIVKFETGREEVFFEKELIADHSNPS